MSNRKDHRVRALVADDAAIVRLVVGTLLASCGCEVVAEAGTGREAVEAWEAHRPDVTLLDLNMPDGDGVSAAVAIRALDPGAAIILASVFVADGRLRTLGGLTGVQVLEKPLAAETIRAALGRLAA